MKTCLILVLLFSFRTGDSGSKVVVIAHQSVPIENTNTSIIADIYQLKMRTWKDGSKIVLFNLKTGDKVKEKFYKSINQDPLNLKKLWLRLQLTGEAVPPDGLETEEEVVKKVASTPGAIGFVSKEKVSDDVKVIAVIK